MKEFLMILFMVLITSCGNSSSNARSGGTEGGDALLDSVPTSLELNIMPSSDGIKWEDSYSTSIAEMLEKPELQTLFEIQLNEQDLKKINCANYNGFAYFEKQLFFVAFIAAIAEAESDFKNHEQTFNKSDRTMNIGLLQIDRASANRHAGKFFNHVFSDKDLRNPEWNLKTGVLILKHQLESKNGRLFPASTYYWEVLTNKSERVIKSFSISTKLLCDEGLK